MIRIALITAAVLSLANFSCSSSSGTETEIVQNTVVHAAVPPCEPTSKRIEFENVSFSYDPCALGDVTANRVDEFRLPRPVNEYKPDGVAPEHIRFEFDKGPEGWEPFVEIYPVKRFPEVYAVDKRMVLYMKREIQDLQRVIKEPTFRVERQIPYLPYVDASQDLQAHVQSSSFRGGNGLYFLTYISIEVTLVCNDHLRYIFEGLTDDGKYYVLAELPVEVPFLPADGGAIDGYDFEGFTNDDLWEMVRNNPHGTNSNPTKYAELTKRYDKYLMGVTKRLEGTSPKDFNPDLNKLRDLVRSIEIK